MFNLLKQFRERKDSLCKEIYFNSDWKEYWDRYIKIGNKVNKLIILNIILFIVMVRMLIEKNIFILIMLVLMNIIYIYSIFKQYHLMRELKEISSLYNKNFIATSVNVLERKLLDIGNMSSQPNKYVWMFMEFGLFLIFIIFFLNTWSLI